MEKIAAETRDLWYKNALFYAVDVDRFQDGNGDGIGDFKGLHSRIDYLADLGVTALWLLPFYPSSNRDNGYAVKDYYNVDPKLGTLQDFTDFVHAAGQRGIRVLIDLVMNHTSNEHPWFEASRRDARSRFRDYYIWTEFPADENRQPVFPGEENAVWRYDELADAYYHHTFYHFQPDLNAANLEVQDEVKRVFDFWLSLGISGIRVDAAPFMTMKKGLPTTKPREPHGLLKDLHKMGVDRNPKTIMLGEADLKPDELVPYFGNEVGEEFQLLLNFLLNNYIYLAMARQEAEPLVDVLRMLPSVHEVGTWANFLRTLDEASMGRLSEDEKQEVFSAFGPEDNMQIYGRGLRRRLAPMLDGDRDRLEMVNSLLFSMPGTPVLMYGDEIGLGEDLKAPGRFSVRTPMQWTSGRNGGFSSASEDKLLQRVIMTGKFGAKKLNVEDQLADEDSFLNWMKQLVAARKQCSELGWGSWHIIDAPGKTEFVHVCEWRGRSVLVVHNLGSKPVKFSLDLQNHRAHGLKHIFGKVEAKKKADFRYEFHLPKYGYGWFRVDVTDN